MNAYSKNFYYFRESLENAICSTHNNTNEKWFQPDKHKINKRDTIWDSFFEFFSQGSQRKPRKIENNDFQKEAKSK